MKSAEIKIAHSENMFQKKILESAFLNSLVKYIVYISTVSQVIFAGNVSEHILSVAFSKRCVRVAQAVHTSSARMRDNLHCATWCVLNSECVAYIHSSQSGLCKLLPLEGVTACESLPSTEDILVYVMVSIFQRQLFAMTSFKVYPESLI